MKIEELNTPALLVDEDKVKRNCTRMLETAEKYGIQLRPMTKTHKTV